MLADLALAARTWFWVLLEVCTLVVKWVFEFPPRRSILGPVCVYPLLFLVVIVRSGGSDSLGWAGLDS